MTVTVTNADDDVDRIGSLQHGEDGSGTDGDSNQLGAVAHERSSALECSRSRWCSDAGSVGGNGWFDAG